MCEVQSDMSMLQPSISSVLIVAGVMWTTALGISGVWSTVLSGSIVVWPIDNLNLVGNLIGLHWEAEVISLQEIKWSSTLG